MAGRGSAPGERRGGRQKGTPNKISASVKEALLEALHAGDGAVSFFTNLKEDDPKTFAHLCGRLLPRELVGAGGKDLIPDVKPPDTWETRMDLARRICWVLNSTTRALDKGQFDDGVKPNSSTEVSS